MDCIICRFTGIFAYFCSFLRTEEFYRPYIGIYNKKDESPLPNVRKNKNFFDFALQLASDASSIKKPPALQSRRRFAFEYHCIVTV